MIGSKVNNYEIQSLIGEGGMGNVYLAEDKSIDKKVAVKAILPHLAKNQHIRDRFMNELKTMSRLQHENIVNLFDYVVNDDGLYLIMEHVDGTPLDDYLENLGRPLEEDLAIEITKQIVSACNHAHSKGIVHRDIKPGNIMITKDGVVKILDFGIAKIVNEEVNKLTKTGLQIGTVYYMAPEQVQGKDVSFQTDIYSIGVTLFQLITGDKPYSDLTNEYQIYEKIVKENLPDPSSLRPELSTYIGKVISKATQKSPSDRFKNCDEFLKVLDEKEIYREKYKNQSIGHENITKTKAQTYSATNNTTVRISNERQISLPNATGALVCGILGILFSWMGILAVVGMILDIIALSLATGSISKYKKNPDLYTRSSLGNAKTGQVLGIIGLCLFSIILIGFILVFVSMR
ncbi:MAG: serine/threonine protein kinase [Crocinitomicaceae bacterium]|jgi:serine/threonine protein kinase